MSTGAYAAAYEQSISDPDAFWGKAAEAIEWATPPATILDDSRPPFYRWFTGGRLNTCFNVLDRHVRDGRGEQAALIYDSPVTGAKKTYTYAALLDEVARFAGGLSDLGVEQGDRVLIYMPMVPEAVFAMLATVRIGAIHSVVFGGFAAASLAARIDDAQPKVMVTSDAGSRGGKAIALKPLVDESIRLATAPPAHVVIVNRGLDPAMARTAGRDLDYAELRAKHAGAKVPVTWLESNEPSYILYTSGTTGRPKGVRVTHRMLRYAAEGAMLCSDARDGDVFFVWEPLYHIGGAQLIPIPLLRDVTLSMVQRFSASRFGILMEQLFHMLISAEKVV